MDTIETRYVNDKGETARSTEKVRYLVTVSFDGVTRLSEMAFAAYSEATAKAWWENEWHFVTVTVTPEVNAVDIDLPQSISGVEWGSAPDWEQDADMSYICKTFAPNLISEVQKELIEFRDILMRTKLTENGNENDDGKLFPSEPFPPKNDN